VRRGRRAVESTALLRNKTGIDLRARANASKIGCILLIDTLKRGFGGKT
jgi:hypothetical protein